ncbi:hypothetical protein [Frigoriglobus tundricola]|uniref:Uncharacterized protein n=1 Tax=Frigoriglobus tundricola TaxID=2774151 RepID=A0A6M5Z1J0_9BACT|nr:hypothetical protein [Frigoriglobus tundricola]QJX00278.1 hypothetical protein FTUN_7903 [Frigoriglobus tundricola]
MTVAALPELHPVVEIRSVEESPPWLIADLEPLSFIRLSGGMTFTEVGSVMAHLVSYNSIEAEPTARGLLSGAVAAEGLILPGGIQVSEGKRAISPRCCCGLEGWREWLAGMESTESPWMGHDPMPWIEWDGDTVRVWSDSGPNTGAFAIEFERGRFAAELVRVEAELRAFLRRVAAWAQEVGFPDPTAVCRKLDACFHITEVIGPE